MPEATVAAIIVNEGSEFVVEPRPIQLRAFWNWLKGLFRPKGTPVGSTAPDDGGLPEAPVPPAGSSSYVLLTRRSVEPYKEQWCLPGGHISQYESAMDAVRREVSEETNLEFHPRFFAHFDEIIESKAIHAVVLAFEGPATGTPQPSPNEVLGMRWFSISAARQMPLAFKHKEILDAYAARLAPADALV